MAAEEQNIPENSDKDFSPLAQPSENANREMRKVKAWLDKFSTKVDKEVTKYLRGRSKRQIGFVIAAVLVLSGVIGYRIRLYQRGAADFFPTSSVASSESRNWEVTDESYVNKTGNFRIQIPADYITELFSHPKLAYDTLKTRSSTTTQLPGCQTASPVNLAIYVSRTTQTLEEITANSANFTSDGTVTEDTTTTIDGEPATKISWRNSAASLTDNECFKGTINESTTTIRVVRNGYLIEIIKYPLDSGTAEFESILSTFKFLDKETPTPSPSASPEATVEEATVSGTPEESPSESPTSTPSATPSATPTPTPTETPAESPSPTPGA